MEQNSKREQSRFENCFEAYLVRQSLTAVEELYAFLSHDAQSLINIYAPNHQLFVPPIGIFGHFRYDKRTGLTLSQSGLFYSVRWRDIKSYEEQLKNKKLEVVGRGCLTIHDISMLVNRIQAAVKTQKEFVDVTSSLIDILG